MASILICHVPHDDAAARELSIALTRRGYRVWFLIEAAKDPNWLSSLYVYDGVIIVWSAATLGSVEFHEIARRALAVNRLISAHTDGATPEHVPAEFRKHGVPYIGDVSGIMRVLGQLLPPRPAAPSPPRRVGAADRETPDVGAAEPRRDPLRNLENLLGSKTDRGQRTEGVGATAEPARGPPKSSGVGSGSIPYPSQGIEGVGAAEVTSASTGRARPTPQQDALAVEAGRLVHKIPDKMWVGEPETVEVRLGRAEVENLAQGLVGRGALTSHEMPIVESMSVSLYARGGTFDIERQSETTQLVSGGDQLKGTVFEQANYGRWIRLVTPRKTGSHMLLLRVSASLKDSRGLPTSASLPDRVFPVSVSVHAGKTTVRILRRGLIGIGGAVAAGLLGAMTQEIWWPKLKSLLESWGWLS